MNLHTNTSVVSILSYVLSIQALFVLYIGHCGGMVGRRCASLTIGHREPQTHPGIVQHTAYDVKGSIRLAFIP